MKSKMFKEEELNTMQDLKRGKNYVQVLCGCTSKKYGDTVGKLKVSKNGRFVIDCECCTDCPEKNMTPHDFEMHSGRNGLRNWKNRIWVFVNDKKVPLRKTVLLKYYKHAANEDSTSCRGVFHRDEFIKCCKCEKLRRFHLRTEQECRIYHAAAKAKRWRCSHLPYDQINCDTEEERKGRKSWRGCPRYRSCKGCTACVCFGCRMCRFRDCNCRDCVDFMQNAEP